MELFEIQAVKQRFGIVGISSALNRAIDVAVQVANTDLSVLITGESGVGKENFPQIIHQYSHRKHNNYIAVNCGAIPEGTIDSELFGHEKGAFTSATADRKGYFEVADGGTIFLDEVGELPFPTQVRLLRVLETGEFMRVGSSKALKTNVRVVAATNMDMTEAIRNGRFREDLYYRLNAVPITVPPLRERKEDIVLLFRKFAADFAEKYRMPSIRLTEEAAQVLQDYYWKGNIRQLKNVTEQISVIESCRDINVEILNNYLPNQTVITLPALSSLSTAYRREKTFDSEREILYQVLFDMKKDINDLKQLVNSLTSKHPHDHADFASTDYGMDAKPFFTARNADNDLIELLTTSAPTKSKIAPDAHVEDTEEYVEESLSLEEAEKEIIIKALDRHRGKRKLAAQDLKISERTLYRKIKDYQLD
ncbi:MAG: sigma-54 dependent transcriptional regulator [Prevotellaceae bacterium]|jgi:DNA-binding NtrC family response regulator|nr:sigma-54 dependent transcriptional regulator [Prevotellaceae bacterium]